jgi:hypothetical protein
MDPFVSRLMLHVSTPYHVFLHFTIGLLQQMETYLKYKIQVYYTLQLSLGG